jgi:hypothetical protein
MDHIAEIGLGAAVAIYIIKTVLEYVFKFKSSSSGVSTQAVSDIFKKIDELKQMCHDLHQWHDVRDGDHVPLWYMRPSLQKSLEDMNSQIATLTANLSAQNELLGRLLKEWKS